MGAFETFLPELTAIRHDIHAHPELGLHEFRTSDLIARKLAEWGFEVTRGIGKTGLVGTLRRPGSNRAVGLRADMDALPITEATGLPYASTEPGKMHACGHDGHVSMLLGAAWRLAHDPEFRGTAHLIFQPDEEDQGGGQRMVKDGLFTRFPCEKIFALHNWPGIAPGHIAIRPGAIMAAIDAVTVTIHGKGGHGAKPEETIDPIVAGSDIVMALQTVVSRNAPPQEAAVVTVGAFQAGAVSNVIPDSARLEISMRATSPALRGKLRERVEAICRTHAEGAGARAELRWQVGYPVTMNDPEAAREAAEAATALFGPENVIALDKPMMASEDFAFMLEEVPGAYALIGNGDSTGLHSATYDFNDALLAPGSAYLHALVRRHCDE